MTDSHGHRSAHERRHDQTVADSFPASDPPANSGITGVGGPDKPSNNKPSNNKPSNNATKHRPPSHQRGEDARPLGTPTSDRHAAEVAHGWEDEDKSRPRPARR